MDAWEVLSLAREPREVAMSLLPRHRVLRLWLRNDGDAPVVLHRDDLILRDERGRDLEAACTPRIQTIEPGQTGAIDLVYRVFASTSPPARLQHAGGATVELAAVTSARRA
ncbi:MAG: hypothetical protein QOE86_3064 [Solirubrobacteraceae bacterium]|jgi:hypothetical protein|nr:hypothetical protein [Solirubrobacteraceae bacterium]